MKLCTCAAGGLNVQAYALDEVGPACTKAPTCILLDKDNRFVEFGKPAREEARRPTGQTEHKYFQNFKMALQGFEKGEEPTVEPFTGPRGEPHRVPVRLLVQRVFECSKKQALETAEEQSVEPVVEVTWVITVPAGWSDKARDLVRRAAADAGLTADKPERKVFGFVTYSSCIIMLESIVHCGFAEGLQGEGY